MDEVVGLAGVAAAAIGAVLSVALYFRDGSPLRQLGIVVDVMDKMAHDSQARRAMELVQDELSARVFVSLVARKQRRLGSSGQRLALAVICFGTSAVLMSIGIAGRLYWGWGESTFLSVIMGGALLATGLAFLLSAIWVVREQRSSSTLSSLLEEAGRRDQP